MAPGFYQRRRLAPLALWVPIDEAFFLSEPCTGPTHLFRDVFANCFKAEAAPQISGLS